MGGKTLGAEREPLWVKSGHRLRPAECPPEEANALNASRTQKTRGAMDARRRAAPPTVLWDAPIRANAPDNVRSAGKLPGAHTPPLDSITRSLPKLRAGASPSRSYQRVSDVRSAVGCYTRSSRGEWMMC
jgi:hypothetical protein